MAEQGSSTKQLVPTLGFGDLMGAAVGQIIGAGIMSLMPSAIATTGRSVFMSFLVAAVLTCCTAIPAIFITSVVKLRGGIYTQLHMVGGDLFAGMYVIIYIMSNMSVSMYGLSLASYLTDLFQIDAKWDKWIALVILTAFLILNLIGLDVFAKVQNLLVIVLIGSLIMFGVMGIGKVNWSTYFQHDQYWMPNGVMGMLEAGGLLVFATGGATTILNYGSEAKNPTRDMPLVIIISTLCVAVMYAILSIVAAGVLPYEQVAGKNLTVVAAHIMPQWGYYVFIIGGAGCALASTLNNSLASKPKPMMQMCDDGWLPQSFAALNKKKVPYKIQLFLYVVAVICTLSGLTVLCAWKGGALDLNIGHEGTTALNAQALGSVFTQKGGAIIIAVGLALFAYSTVLGWALYGTRCCEFLFGVKAIRPYQILFLVVIFVGATMKLDLAWAIADTLNGLMAIPNLIALFALSGVVVKETKRHFSEVPSKK